MNENPRAHARDPWTSHAAAETVDDFAKRHNIKIVAALEANRLGGLTSEQIADATGLTMVAVARRMKEIEKAGIVYRSTYSIRTNRSGRYAHVWYVKDKVAA